MDRCEQELERWEQELEQALRMLAMIDEFNRHATAGRVRDKKVVLRDAYAGLASGAFDAILARRGIRSVVERNIESARREPVHRGYRDELGQQILAEMTRVEARMADYFDHYDPATAPASRASRGAEGADDPVELNV